MKVIIFHDENGLDVSDVYRADTEEQLDNADTDRNSKLLNKAKYVIDQLL